MNKRTVPINEDTFNCNEEYLFLMKNYWENNKIPFPAQQLNSEEICVLSMLVCGGTITTYYNDNNGQIYEADYMVAEATKIIYALCHKFNGSLPIRVRRIKIKKSLDKIKTQNLYWIPDGVL